MTAMMSKKLFFNKVLWLSICFITSLGLATTGAASATVYYVAPSGSDSNPGTSASPWATIQRAVNIGQNPQVVSGDTIIVKAGTYTFAGPGPYVYNGVGYNGPHDDDGNHAPSGAQSVFWNTVYVSGITIKSETKWGAVLDGAKKCHSVFALFSNNLNNITIQDFEIKNGYWGGIYSSNFNYPPHNITIKGCNIHHCGHNEEGYSSCYGMVGIYPSPNSYGWMIDGCMIHDIGRLNNTNTSNGHNYYHDQGVYLCGYNQTVQNSVFWNVIHGWPISPAPDTTHYPNDGTNLRIVNNTFVGANPIMDGQISTGPEGIKNCIWANNIFYQPTGAPVMWTSSGGTPGVPRYTSGGNIFRNNLTTWQGPYIDREDPVGGPIYWRRNTSIDSYIKGGANYYSSDPLFIDPANHNYHIRTDTSQAVGDSYPAYTPTLDFDGNVRTNNTIGAFDYVGSNPPPLSGGDDAPVGIYVMQAGSGQTLADTSGNANNGYLGTTSGTDSADPAWADTALTFDGALTGATIPHNNKIDNLPNFTYSIWVSATGHGSSLYPRIWDKSGSGSPDVLLFPYTSGVVYCIMYNTTGTWFYTITTTTIPLDGARTQVGVKYADDGDRKGHIFINGVEASYSAQDTVTGTLKTSANDLILGNSFDYSKPFQGVLDNLQVWNRAISDAEMLDVYNNSWTPPAPGPGADIGAAATGTTSSNTNRIKFIWNYLNRH
jgi:hypothetical protein